MIIAEARVVLIQLLKNKFLPHFSLNRDSLRQAMIQRSLSFTQMIVIDYGVNNPNELGK